MNDWRLYVPPGVKPFDTSYNPAAVGYIRHPINVNSLVDIGGETDVVNYTPQQCYKLVHLLLGIYAEERTAAENGRPPNFLRTKMDPIFLRNKETRQKHTTQTNVLLIGLVSVKPLLAIIRLIFRIACAQISR